MAWLFLALGAAFCESCKDVASKSGLRQLDAAVAAWAFSFFSLPFLLPLLILLEIPELSGEFWLALVIGGGLNLLALLLFMRAIQASDLSAAVPLIAFTPLFLLLTSPLLVGEFPGSWGLGGVLLIVIGAYLLNLRERHQGYLAPLRAILTNPGPRLMLAVAFIWSLTSNIDKIGVQHSSPFVWGAAINLLMAGALLPAVLLRMRGGLRLSRSHLPVLLPIGLFNALTLIFQFLALTLTLVPYVIAVKRSSTLISVIMGHYLFGEIGLRERLGGASLMFLGLVLIILDTV